MENFSLEKIEKEISDLAAFKDSRSAYKLYKEISSFMAGQRMDESSKEFSRYYRTAAKLKFLSLNYFDDWQEADKMIADDLDAALEMEDFDLWDKLETNLMAVNDLDQRDEIKAELKKTLMAGKKNIFPAGKYAPHPALPSSIGAWLRDFYANTGGAKINNLKKIDYLSNGDNIRVLDPGDREKVKKLFRLYENLSLSSNQPEGFEGDVPIEIDGKLYIFNRGVMEPVGEAAKKARTVSAPGAGGEEKLRELRQMREFYEEGTLERKAIEEEIKRSLSL